MLGGDVVPSSIAFRIFGREGFEMELCCMNPFGGDDAAKQFFPVNNIPMLSGFLDDGGFNPEGALEIVG